MSRVAFNLCKIRFGLDRFKNQTQLKSRIYSTLKCALYTCFSIACQYKHRRQLNGPVHSRYNENLLNSMIGSKKNFEAKIINITRKISRKVFIIWTNHGWQLVWSGPHQRIMLILISPCSCYVGDQSYL